MGATSSSQQCLHPRGESSFSPPHCTAHAGSVRAVAAREEDLRVADCPKVRCPVGDCRRLDGAHLPEKRAVAASLVLDSNL